MLKKIIADLQVFFLVLHLLSLHKPANAGYEHVLLFVGLEIFLLVLKNQLLLNRSNCAIHFLQDSRILKILFQDTSGQKQRRC